MKELWSIQYLRALAALSVVVFHMAEGSGGWFQVGSAGVDLFFVISGFIMWGVTETKERSAREFIRRRLLRILPLYWACTLLYFASYRLKPGLFFYADTDPTGLVLSLLFVPHLDSYGHNWPTLIQGWTLNIEMFFYALVALALLLPRRLQLSLITALLCVLSLAGAVLQPRPALLQSYTSGLLLEFVAGLWIGRLAVAGRLPSAKVGGVMLVAGFLLFALVSRIEHPDGVRVIAFGVPALLILVGALALEQGGALPKWQLPKALGDASYSIYLLHVLVGAVIVRLPVPLSVKVGGALVVSALVGDLAFRYFERRVGSWLRTRRLSPLVPSSELGETRP